jgi:hypothetical protein
VIKHVVMWKMKPQAEGADGATNAAKVKALLESCRDLVPGMLAWEVALAQPGLEALVERVETQAHDVDRLADETDRDFGAGEVGHAARPGSVGCTGLPADFVMVGQCP